MQLDNGIFTALGGTGRLNAAFFKNLALGAADGDDFILYDGATGALFYDADALGAGAAVRFVTLLGAPVVTFADFTVF